VLINALNQLGYYFRLNEADDSVELNGERITDVMRATMRSKLRDVGLSRHLAAAEDAWIMDAGRNRYHPVRQYLDGLKWDGANWITRLTEYFDDVPYRATNGKEHHLLPTYLRKWLIGAVARAYTGCQNAVLTLEGRQGLGKSRFAKWLCPIAGMYRDAPVNPDDKDSQTALLSAWIWEIGELGSTTRRSDVDALKGFLTRELVTVRPPYAHYDIKKQALANFLATVNNSSGFLSDPSGNRRFWAVTVRMIDWGYADLDVNQVWAEAAAAYRQGEEWTLSSDEAELAASQNEAFEVPDPIEDLLRKEYRLDPRNRTIWTPTAEILTNLQEHGLQGNTRANSMGLAATLKRLGFEKRRDPATDVRGYWGVWR
jgi:putative DNA primase/helicase